MLDKTKQQLGVFVCFDLVASESGLRPYVDTEPRYQNGYRRIPPSPLPGNCHYDYNLHHAEDTAPTYNLFPWQLLRSVWYLPRTIIRRVLNNELNEDPAITLMSPIIATATTFMLQGYRPGS